MIRVTSLMTLGAAVALLVAGAARAQLPVAPAPREVRSDLESTRPRAAVQTPSARESSRGPGRRNGRSRIIKNSKDVTDKLLAKTDTTWHQIPARSRTRFSPTSTRRHQPAGVIPPPPQDDKRQQERQEHGPDDEYVGSR